MTALPDPYVLDDAGRLVGDSVQRNFDALATGGTPVGVFGVAKRSGSTRATVTWPGGTAMSNTITVTHNFGSGITLQVLGQLLESAYVGPCIVGVTNLTANAFQVNVTTLGFQPVAGTQRAVTVAYWEV